MHAKFEVRSFNLLELSVDDVMTMEWRHYHYDVMPLRTDTQTERQNGLTT